MANIFEPTEQQKTQWEDWVKNRPDVIRKIAEKFYPWKLYKLKTSGHRVTIYSIDEDNPSPTFKVIVSGEFNFVAFERTVFGVNPEDLEECDLPSPNELRGTLGISIEEIKRTQFHII